MKKKRVFLQILISYLVILIIPMLILGGMVFNFFFRTYNAELLANHMDDLTSFQLSTDSIISGLNANAYTMFHSKEFTTRYLKESYGNFLDVTNKLSDNALTNDFIAGSFYANKDLGWIFTSQTIYSYEDFNTYNQGYDIAPEQMDELLIRDKRSYWLPTQTVGRLEPRQVLTYVVTNKVGMKAGDASVFFQLNTKKLDELAGKLNARKASTLIAGYDGSLLYASNPELANREWSCWLESGSQRSGEPVTLNIDGKAFIIIQISSTKSPLLYASIVPYEEIMAPVEQNRKVFFTGIVIIALVCAVFISYFMKINYSPIRAISKLAGTLFGENKEANELESTRLALISINKRQAELMREHLTLKLMRGGFSTLEELEREGAPYDYRLTGPLFRVIVFRIEGSDQKPDLAFYQDVSELIESSISVYTEAVAINYSEGDTIYLVISGGDADLRGLSEKYRQIKNVIENTFSTCLSVGVGNVVPIENVQESTSQATAASNYNFVKGKGSITFYKEIEGMKGKLSPPYPARELDALYNAILRGEGERAEFAMNTLAKHIQDSKSFFYGTCLAFDTLNTAMRAMRELGFETKMIEKFTVSGKGAPRSIDEVIEIVNSMTGEIVRAMSESRGEQAAPAIPMNQLEQIIQYITERYGDETFSVKNLAAHFHISVSNLSHFFKKNTGQTVSEYISLLRFEKAKDLLCNTDMNLQDISLKCGYLHLSTFMRQFKQRAGCTPANYRMKQQSAADTRLGSV